MSFLKFTTIFSLAGFLFPILIRAIWIIIDQNGNINLSTGFQKITFLLWPTFLMAIPSSQKPGFETQLFLISLCANVIFYTIIGVLLWLGLRKHTIYFFIAGVPLILIWLWLLNL